MLSFIKNIFSKKTQDTNILKKHKWSINIIKIYISPLRISGYKENEEKYKNMVIQAFDTWVAASGGKFSCEICENLCDSYINVEWKKFDKKSFGACSFNYDDQGRLYSAEISIGLFPKKADEIRYDAEIYHSILHCCGIALGVAQTNNPEDIMCIPHQYGKIELSENDRKSIFDLYNSEEIEVEN